MTKTFQVWQINLAVPPSQVEQHFGLLTTDERQRAHQFKFETDRRRFIVARGVLRCLLAGPVGMEPSQVRFRYGPFGKPTITGLNVSERAQKPSPTAEQHSADHCGLHFNLSHSGDLAVCVLGNQQRVGVDIEKLKKIERLAGMMNRCLTSQERAEVSIADEPSRTFLKYWTAKEAYLKAIGKGLSQPMQSVEIDLNAPALIQVPEGKADSWSLRSLSLPSGFVGAVVTEGAAPIELRTWNHD